jgi:hypothetical protein
MTGTAEFLAQNIGVLGLLQRGARNTAIKTRGDNMTALAWGRERWYRGEKSEGAAIAQVAMLGRTNADITETRNVGTGRADNSSKRWKINSRHRAFMPSEKRRWTGIRSKKRGDG